MEKNGWLECIWLNGYGKNFPSIWKDVLCSDTNFCASLLCAYMVASESWGKRKLLWKKERALSCNAYDRCEIFQNAPSGSSIVRLSSMDRSVRLFYGDSVGPDLLGTGIRWLVFQFIHLFINSNRWTSLAESKSTAASRKIQFMRLW